MIKYLVYFSTIFPDKEDINSKKGIDSLLEMNPKEDQEFHHAETENAYIYLNEPMKAYDFWEIEDMLEMQFDAESIVTIVDLVKKCAYVLNDFSTEFVEKCAPKLFKLYGRQYEIKSFKKVENIRELVKKDTINKTKKTKKTMEAQFVVLLGKRIPSDLFQEYLDMTEGNKMTLLARDSCENCTDTKNPLLEEYLEEVENNVRDTMFVQEMETILAPPETFPTLQDAEKAIKEIYLEAFSIIVLVNLTNGKAFNCKGIESKTLKELFLEKFFRIYTWRYNKTMPPLSTIQDLRDYYPKSGISYLS